MSDFARSREAGQNIGIEVLYDDRKESAAGAKFADADLIGIPWRMVISEKTVAKSSVELKQRNKEETILVQNNELHEFFTEHSIKTRARHSN